MSFGDRVKELRQHLGLTQQEFADKIGISKQQISAVEQDTRGITLERLSFMIRQLNIRADFLFGLVDIKEATADFSSKDSRLEELIRENERLRNSSDDTALRIANNPALRDLVSMIQFWPEEMLHRIRDLVYGYYAGVQDEQKKGDTV